MNGLPEFDLVTDHQTLKTIYGPRSKPSARIERWVLRLQPYNYRGCFVSARNKRKHVVWRDSVGVESSRPGLKSVCADIFHQSFLWFL